ncbi:MAG: ABC transporter ATP-binding protein [Firmicutes bacterium]|nr:ABC transporter ATP-binding protein [Bacillota bacterium]
MGELYFKTKGLTVGYNGKPLIRDIEFGVERGEILTLIGPNGSGKSTILKSITKQLKILAGTVYIAEDDLKTVSAKELAKKMSVVLTERMKPELMSCRDIVATGRYPYTGNLGLLSEEDEAIVQQSMESVHVLDLQNRDFNAISDGQRQRVLLARALCQQPEIIILDEPTSFLDIRHKLELLSLLRKLTKERDIAVIMSLHEIDLAQKVSDKVICVKGEIIARYGTPAEVFQEETIRELYGIENGTYDPLFGSIELGRPQGTPEILVLSNGGSGIPVYRDLQKQGTPFAAAILSTNDMDYAVARHMATEIVTAAPFQPITEEALDRTMALVRSCKEVIDAGVTIGQTNQAMEEILAEAERLGKRKKVKQHDVLPV